MTLKELQEIKETINIYLEKVENASENSGYSLETKDGLSIAAKLFDIASLKTPSIKQTAVAEIYNYLEDAANNEKFSAYKDEICYQVFDNARTDGVFTIYDSRRELQLFAWKRNDEKYNDYLESIETNFGEEQAAEIVKDSAKLEIALLEEASYIVFESLFIDARLEDNEKIETNDAKKLLNELCITYDLQRPSVLENFEENKTMKI